MKHLCGWIHSPNEINKLQASLKYPTLKCAMPLGELKKETTLLYKCANQLLGEFPCQIQETGDCTSFGTAHAVDTLKCVEIVLKNEFEEFKAKTSTEFSYGLTRTFPEYGNNIFRGKQGSNVVWCADALQKYGCIDREIFEGVDLRNYDVRKAISWGDNGIPQFLLKYASTHKVQTITRITSEEEVIYALTNGYPIIVAGSAAFLTQRDQNGFSDVNPNDSWPHAQCATGIRFDLDEYGAVCVQNSWMRGWISGPTTLDQHWGSYWLKMSTFCENLLEDSWSVSFFSGYPQRDLSLRWL